MNEQTLFDYLKSKYWGDLTQSKDKYSFYDCFSESTKTRIELKCRKRHYLNLLNYQIGIQQRIGADRLLELHSRAHDVKKWTKDELNELIKRYKQKINEF